MFILMTLFATSLIAVLVLEGRVLFLGASSNWGQNSAKLQPIAIPVTQSSIRR